MSAAAIASKEGFNFEKAVYDELLNKFTDGFIIRSEKEVIEEYGPAITAIDIELSNVVKTKDKNKIPSKSVLIQLKWRDSASSVRDVNHFAQCCNDIISTKNLDSNNVLCIYGTKVPISSNAVDALKRLTVSENICMPDFNICVNTIVNRILTFYDRKTIVLKQEFQDTYDENTNYEEIKKDILKDIVIKRYNYKSSHLSKHKKSDLIDIIVNKNSVNNLEENMNKLDVKDENPVKVETILKLEYDDPTKRNDGENRSKLLKKNSEMYNHIKKLRSILESKGFKHEGYDIDLHTEVLNRNDKSVNTFLSRVALLEGRTFNINDQNNYDIVGRAVAFMVGDLEGYENDAKITIAFLPGKNLKAALQVIYDTLN
jgi:hypothetical protein